MRTSVWFARLMCALSTMGASSYVLAEQSPSVLFRDVSRSVVLVKSVSNDLDRGVDSSPISVENIGSGVLIDGGRVLTAAHIVNAANTISISDNGDQVSAEVERVSLSADLAVLSTRQRLVEHREARLADSDRVQIGDSVIVIGAPYGLEKSLSVGHLSGRMPMGEMIDSVGMVEFLQSDAAINQGNSGGPMFDMEGGVIGVVSYFISKSGGFEGIGFAASSNVAKNLLDNGVPYFGIEGLRLNKTLSDILNVPEQSILIQRVAPRSVGDRLGLRGGSVRTEIGARSLILGGDVIVGVQGSPPGPDVMRRLRELRKGGDLVLDIIRGGVRQQLKTVF